MTTGGYENEEEVQEVYDSNEFNNDFDDEEADFECCYLSVPSKLLVINIKLIILLLTLLEYWDVTDEKKDAIAASSFHLLHTYSMGGYICCGYLLFISLSLL